jgi:succinoglycan biosynthesis transport protein ExoP
MKKLASDEYYQLPPPGYYSSVTQNERNEREVTLRDYWKVIRKRRWTIIAFFLIVVVTTAVVTFTIRPIYRGTATIQINKENPQIVDFKEIFAVNTTDRDYYQTQYKLLESRKLARRVIHLLKLSEHPEFLPQVQTPLQKWKSSIRTSLLALFTSSGRDLSEVDKQTILIDRFLEKVEIEPIRSTRLVQIHFDSYYPELSKRISNALAREYIQQNLEARVVATEQAKEWLNKQLDLLKAKVERADEALQAFASKHDIISLEEKENITIQRLTELNEALTSAESERMAKEALDKQAKDRNFESLPLILQDKLVQDLKQNYIQLDAQYMRLSKTFKPDYPEMVRLKNHMDTIRKRIDGEVNKIVASIKNDYQSSLRRESLLREAFQRQKAKAMEMKQKAIQYNILKREADTNRELHNALLQRMKEAGVSAGITACNIQIVDQAELPTKPFRPNTPLNLLVSIVAGLLFGVGLAFFLEYLDNTVKTPEDVEQLIQLPSFGMIPEISYERQRQLDKGIFYPVELITFGHSKSMLSEAYRNVRTSILLSFSEKPPKRIAISSPNPAEGKTTTVINTAIALSQMGVRVLIIDSDMRKPRVHAVFGEKNGMGLSNFLSGNAELKSTIKRSNIPNLFYIPSGPIPPNPSELLGSNLFKATMQFLGEKFDHIVLDSPPVLGFADSIILSTSVDGIILVVQGGKTPIETLQRSKDALLQVNAKILGVVINRVDIGRSGYGYYYYRYHYYYGKHGKKKELPYTSDGGATSP